MKKGTDVKAISKAEYYFVMIVLLLLGVFAGIVVWIIFVIELYEIGFIT